MAINATFKADFSSFQDAVAKAEVALADFSKGAGRAESSLNRMVDNFSGRKVIQDATLMERALQEIGGTSKLTEAELKRVAVTASEAVTKMKALGVDVPPGLQKIANETKGIDTAARDMLGAVGKIAGAFGIAFSVGAVVNFGKAILSDADALTKMHDKTGISIEGLQAMRIAGDDAGVSLETMTTSVNRLQKQLGGNDAGTIKALRDMGISVEAFKRLDGAQQMDALSKAVKGMDDPLRVANDLSEIFGKNWAEQLPVLKRGFDELADGTGVMSEAAVKALDDTGDAIERVMRQTKATIAEVVGRALIAGPTIVSLFSLPGLALPQGFKDQIEEALLQLKMLQQAEKGLKDDTQLTAKEIAAQAEQAVFLKNAEKELSGVLERTASAERERAAAVKKTAAEQKRLAEELKKADEAFKSSVVSGQKYHLTVADLTTSSTLFDSSVFRVKSSVGDLSHKFAQNLNPVMLEAGGNMKALAEEANKAGAIFKTAFGGLNDIFQSAFEGGGGLTGAITSFATQLTKGLTSLIPVVGPILSQFAGALVGGVKRLFGGPSKEELATREKQQGVIDDFRKMGFAGDDFAVLMGAANKALVGVGKTAEDVRRTVEKLLDTKNPQNFASAMKEVQAALDLQKNSQDALNEAISRYKFTTEELGPALAGQKLSEQSQQLFKDWQVLTGAGVDIAAVGREMQGSINAFIQDALKTKTEVDPALRPMLESMAKMGLLTDEAGTQITDLEGHGITFAQTMSEGFKSVVDEVKKLTDTIRLSLGLALDTTKDKILKMPDVDVNVNYNDPGFQGGPVDAIPMAQGGAGRVTKPTLFLAGENGAEDFAFSGGGKSFGGGGTQIIQVVLPDGQVLAEVVNRENDARNRLRYKGRAA